MNTENRLTSKKLLILAIGIAAILAIAAIIGEIGKQDEEKRVSVLRTDGITQVVEVENVETATELRRRVTTTSEYVTYAIDGHTFREKLQQSEKGTYNIGSQITVCYADGISRYDYENCAN